MKKNLIALAVVAAFAVPAVASADATLYGKLHASFGSVDDGTESGTAVASHASRIGVKGSEDLGEGLKAVYKMEFQVDIADDAGADSNMKSRNQYVGLSGGFGTVLLGRHDTPNKMATGFVDNFGDTYADYNNIITNDNRANNVLAYVNKFGPVQVVAAYVTDTGKDDLAGEDTATSIMGKYSANGVTVAVSTESINAADETAQEQTRIAGGYKTKAFAVNGVYQMLDADGEGAGEEQANMLISANFKAGNGITVKAAFGTNDMNDDNGDAVNQTTLGVSKKFSKKTSAYILTLSGDEGNKYESATAAGIVTKF